MAKPKQIKPYHSKRGTSYHIFGICNVGKRVKRKLSGKKGGLCTVCKEIRAGKRPR